jgi:uncharacterized lipoprotein YajG
VIIAADGKSRMQVRPAGRATAALLVLAAASLLLAACGAGSPPLELSNERPSLVFFYANN